MQNYRIPEGELLSSVENLMMKGSADLSTASDHAELHEFLRVDWHLYNQEMLSCREEILTKIGPEAYLFLAARVLLFIRKLKARALEVFFVDIFLTLPSRRALDWLDVNSLSAERLSVLRNSSVALLEFSSDLLNDDDWGFEEDAKFELLADLRFFRNWLHLVIATLRSS